ncbi:MAG TPA: fused MFS/spermidine synthase [Candidatus Bathyarchaeia archaeon]|nr:fused MFS/spermidine synthase [Candidatus Bathyarchaeia archaeon]
MNNIKKSSLPFVVFSTGACVLVMEVIATRILSPYFGNTIFTVSSVIGVVLAALSVGYYFGGKLADKYPSEKFFYTIILTSGLSVIFLHLLNLFLLPTLGYGLSIVSGPIISAVILFFLPSLLLGTLSPFAIKLQGLRFPEKGIGSITGEIFFWSTLGSIFGSLFTGFVLIPQFGINQIILTIALILTILGLIPLLKPGNYYKSLLPIVLFIIVGVFLIVTVSSFKNNNIIYSHDGVYEKITIYDEEYNGKPTRFFRQDRNNSGAMFLNSNELVFGYTKYYALYQIFKPMVKNALIIGGGAYSIPKALLNDIPGATIDVSEIEPSLFELARKYFRVTETERLHNYTEDGRRLLHDTDKRYDLIFSDVYYSLFSIPAHFTTQEFFKIAKSKLNDDGIFIANLIGDLSQQEPSLIMSEIRTFQTAFPNCYFFAVDSPDKIESQNIIFVGYNSDKKIDFNDQKITGNKNPTIRSLGKKIINLSKFDFSSHPVMTDNFSPVEYLTAKVLHKEEKL